MPNIQIHMQFNGGHPSVDARTLEAQIWERTEGLTFKDEIVVSFFDTWCVNRAGVPQPFIRIVSKDPGYLMSLKVRLGDLANIETARLDDFFPKSKGGESTDRT